MYINILEAYYGFNSGSTLKDVTTQVKSLCVGEISEDVKIWIDPTTFKIPDPIRGTRKTFLVRYTTTSSNRFTSPEIYQMGVDGDTITIEAKAAGILIAKRAVYGSYKHNYDITDAFNRFLCARPKSTSIAVDSSLFGKFCYGSDIDPYVPKSLYLHLSNTELAEDLYVCGNDGETVSWDGL